MPGHQHIKLLIAVPIPGYETTAGDQNVARRAWKPFDLPAWLNTDAYLAKVQPCLARFTRPAIAAALDVSIKYAGDVRAGTRIPHPRHWERLAELVGIGTPK
jgi:hypothetical protein